MKKIKAFILSSSLFAPVLAFAQNPNDNYVTTLIQKLKDILNSLIPLLIVVAILFFFWELVMFIKTSRDGDANKSKDAKKGLMWALFAIFIMLSFLGIIRIFQGITGTSGQNVINQYDVPQLTL